MNHPADMVRYYAERAAEYERIYALPERQDDLARLREVVAEFGRGRRVLEVACGTGYWTQALAAGASSVVATDAGDAVLGLARDKGLPAERALFQRVDAFALEQAGGDFEAAFAGFWWSHLARSDVQRFLCGLHARLRAGARVLFLDNRHVEGSSTPIARTDAEGNSYQRRVLANGGTHEVLKNFPSAGEIRSRLAAVGVRSVELVELPYYWYVGYSVESPVPQAEDVQEG
jgi:demethylmenaquinone methyltransferase/2-methoxy-6-polyprenyl-1,4-benzoquinol methylase